MTRALLRASILFAAAAAGPAVVLEVQELRSVGGLPAHLAGAFDEISACHLTTDGNYVVFDRRAHAVYAAEPGAAKPRKIVQIGFEPGKLLRPLAFDSAPDGTFVVADAPEGRNRVQFFVYTGGGLGGFMLPGSRGPQLTVGSVVVTGIGSLEYLGESFLISQPETGALVTEYSAKGQVLRTFGDLRPTGFESDAAVHQALNAGLPLANPKGGFYYVFVAGTPMFRKYTADGTLEWERHIEGLEVDPYLRVLPNTWQRRQEDGRLPLPPVGVRTAAVDPEGNLWVSLAAPVTYVYDLQGDKRRILRFRAAGVVSPASFFFTAKRQVLVTPGCYAFPLPS